MNRIGQAVVVVVALTAGSGVARAHRLAAGQFTAPVPLSMVLLGAGLTVAATAAWLGWGDGVATGTEARPVLSVPPAAARAVAVVARVGFLFVFVAALVHGLLGRSVPAENLATLVLWPLVVKGVGLVAVLVGSPWRLLSPWGSLYDLLAAVEGRPVAVLGSYPSWLGAWPAVAGFVLGVGILENLTVVTRSPAATVAIAAGYAAVMLVGAAAFGREWLARADALAVLFDLLGRVAPLEWSRTDDGTVTLAVRPPWTGATSPLADTSVAVFAVAALYTVSFDGFTATRVYGALLLDARAPLGVGTASVTLYSVGLAAFVLAFLAAAALVERLGGRTAGQRGGAGTAGWSESARAFGGTLIPIAAAYEVAHNYPFVAANLGGALTVVRDLLVGAGAPITPLGWLPVAAFWASQVALVVGGHLVAVVAAHRVATRRYGSGARRGHAPLVVLMVGYTVLSLWIVSQPVVA